MLKATGNNKMTFWLEVRYKYAWPSASLNFQFSIRWMMEKNHRHFFDLISDAEKYFKSQFPLSSYPIMMMMMMMWNIISTFSSVAQFKFLQFCEYFFKPLNNTQQVKCFQMFPLKFPTFNFYCHVQHSRHLCKSSMKIQIN